MRIDVSNVEFRYEQTPILQNINVRIESGDLTVLCGQTGSGKSTLLQVLAGLETPTLGTVTYETSYAESNVTVAMVFQQPETQLFAGTVRDELEYGLKLRKVPKLERVRRVEQALEIVGLQPAAFLERSPFLLSGGEKRRVAIATSLVLEPDVLLLDEPTAGLDPQSTRELVTLLQDLRQQGLTIVVATHDLDKFFPIADQILVMLHGQIVYDGNRETLLEDPSILSEAGLELPTAARIAYRLRRSGFGETVPLEAESLRTWFAEGHWRGLSTSIAQVHQEEARLEKAKLEEGKLEEASTILSNNRDNVAVSPLLGFDPRMKWLGLVVLSVVILGLDTGWGLSLATLIVGGLSILAQISLRKIKLWLRPFLIGFLLLWMLSAITLQHVDWRLGPIGIDVQAAVAGGFGILQFLLIIYLGMLFSETTTGAPLREGFERMIKPLKKLGIPTRDVSLAVSITLQFAPWILNQMGQLQKAAASRGVGTTRQSRWKLRQVTAIIVPLLISILKLGDELATAIESRGYDRKAEKTSLFQLQWKQKDTWALTIISGAAILLWFM